MDTPWLLCPDQGAGRTLAWMTSRKPWPRDMGPPGTAQTAARSGNGYGSSPKCMECIIPCSPRGSLIAAQLHEKPHLLLLLSISRFLVRLGRRICDTLVPLSTPIAVLLCFLYSSSIPSTAQERPAILTHVPGAAVQGDPVCIVSMLRTRVRGHERQKLVEVEACFS